MDRNKITTQKDTEDDIGMNGMPQPIEGPVVKVYTFILLLVNSSPLATQRIVFLLYPRQHLPAF